MCSQLHRQNGIFGVTSGWPVIQALLSKRRIHYDIRREDLPAWAAASILLYDHCDATSHALGTVREEDRWHITHSIPSRLSARLAGL